MGSWLRSGIAGVGIAILAAQGAGCGAAPGEEETTPVAASELRPLEIAQPEARLRSVEGANAMFDITVVITNPNAAPVYLRRATGELMLDGNRVAQMEVDGEDPIDADSERAIIFDVSVPVAMLVGVQADQYVARGTLFADGGTGDGALQTPFELMGAVPRVGAGQ